VFGYDDERLAALPRQQFVELRAVVDAWFGL